MHTAFVPFGRRRIRLVLHGMGAPRPPVVCVPGGPAMSHHYIEPMAALAATGRPVIFFDPLGSGGSDRPDGETWDHEVYLAELDAVIATLALPRYHLFAHSVASFAAIPFAARRPATLASLVLASAPASMPAYQASVRRLLQLDADALARFERADRGDAVRDAAYVRVYQAFLLANMCTIRPTPPQLWEGIRQMNTQAHARMKGGAILYSTPLGAWDATRQLGEIPTPTLVTCGRNDIFSPDDATAVQRALPRGELAIFEHSSHMPHFEQPDAYIARISAFLELHDAEAA